VNAPGPERESGYWLLVVCRGKDEGWVAYHYSTGRLRGESKWSEPPMRDVERLLKAAIVRGEGKEGPRKAKNPASCGVYERMGAVGFEPTKA
jgi:hypothetical protein